MRILTAVADVTEQRRFRLDLQPAEERAALLLFSCFTALIAMACKSLAAVSLLAAVRPRL